MQVRGRRSGAIAEAELGEAGLESAGLEQARLGRRKAGLAAMAYAGSLAGGLALLGLGLSGCDVTSTSNKATGQQEVKISTPLGGFEANTGQTTAASLGLAVYPGAKVVAKQGDGSSANVRMG